MRISQWKQYFNLTRVIFTILIFVSIFPASFVEMLILNDCSQDETAVNELQGADESFVDVTRFMNETENTFSSQTESSQNNRSTPYSAIGSQTGLGGGIYNVFDTLNVVNTTSLTTENNVTTGELPPVGEGTGTPSEHNASFTIGAVTDFTRNDLQFEIQSVTSTPDWREIENETVGVDARQSSTYIEAAQEINITDDYANITHVHIYLRYYDAAFGSGGIPTGTVSIFDDSGSGGEPGIQLGSTTLQDGFTTADVGLDMTAWITYEFPNPINVTKGKYWLVLNDTSANAANYWVWYTQKDSNGEDYGEWLARSTHGGIWNHEPFPAGDIVSAIKILPTDVNMNKLTYSNPDEISMTYNTTDGNYTLTSFTFKANSTSQHVFYANTSVDFVLESVANYSYTTNPISGKSSYKVQNNTVYNWNITFSITKVSNPNGFIRNRTIRIIGIQSDWNGTKIYWNDSSTPEYLGPLDSNANVTYVNSSSTMVVNASTLAENTTWHIWFDAPNYITEFNWFDPIIGSNVTTATSMDTLEAKITFDAPNVGGHNFSIWIESQSGTRIYADCNKTVAELANDWNITQTTISLPVVNGTYQSYAFWLNTTQNQVGFYARNITVFIHTTPIINAPTEVIEDTSLEIIVYFNATHNSTGINKANVTGVPNWGNKQPVQFEHSYSPHGYYNYTWDINSTHFAGQELNVTIYLQMPWHLNHTIVWNTTVVFTSTLSALDVPNPLILEYGQNYLLRVNYTSGTSFIFGATMTVDGDNVNFSEVSEGTYYYSFWLNTTNYNSGENYLNLLIQLNCSGYLTQEFYFNLTVNAGPTSVHQAYSPSIPSIYYTENYTFSVFYNNTVDNKGIINANYYTTYSSAIDFWYNSSGYYFFNLSSIYLSLGSLTVNVTLNHSNYQESNILLTFNIVEMPTEPLDSYSISSNQIMVEETITVSIDNYQTYKFKAISEIDNALILLNDSSVDSSHVTFTSNAPFSIELDTLGIQYGKYNMMVILNTYGYESQAISFNVSINGYETIISVEIEPGKNIQQGEDIIFTATLAYLSEGGTGAGVTQQVLLGGVEITFYVVIEYENGTTKIYEAVKQTDSSNFQATYTIDGIYTKDATKFTNITIFSAPSLSGLPYTYTMPANELETYKILPPAIDIFEVITAVLIAVVIVLISGFLAISTVRIIRRRRRTRKQLILRHDLAIEQSFEDIKSIRLIIARHESGLQFYSEKTIAELSTDTDALSGMSAALSSFMEEVSESMVSRPEDLRKEKIEVMSREGLHMLVWHGYYSSLIIISEIRLPDYFRDRLGGLGRELEAKFVDDLQDFYSTDQIPSSIVKKMVRKYIPLHYFSAFVLNEGVLTLESIKLSKKDQLMLKRIKEVLFEKKGVQYFFSEQIISHLSKRYKRSEAIEFLDRAIFWNLLVECSQEDLLQLGQ
ncbi:MAG: hypothetical protein ACFE9L_00615 [Candidatus Hodarchaeota archaeon]